MPMLGLPLLEWVRFVAGLLLRWLRAVVHSTVALEVVIPSCGCKAFIYRWSDRPITH